MCGDCLFYLSFCTVVGTHMHCIHSIFRYFSILYSLFLLFFPFYFSLVSGTCTTIQYGYEYLRIAVKTAKYALNDCLQHLASTISRTTQAHSYTFTHEIHTAEEMKKEKKKWAMVRAIEYWSNEIYIWQFGMVIFINIY